MSNLRDLIHYADLAQFETVVGAASSTCTNINYGSEYPQIKIWGGGSAETDPGQLDTHGTWKSCTVWKAPQGTKFIRFDIWGAGGAGGSAQCCTWGYPGGSGAWTYKILCCREYGDLSGCPYDIFAAVSPCKGAGSAGSFATGTPGDKSYIRGYGLCNFCAEGGNIGRTCCSHTSSHFLCGTYCDYETERRHQASGGNHFANVNETYAIRYDYANDPEKTGQGYCHFASGANYTDEAGTHDSWPGYGKFNNENRIMCSPDLFDDGYINRMYGVGYGNTYGSNCQRINDNYYGYNVCFGGLVYRSIQGRGICAAWWGGDGGYHGLPGMAGSPCNNQTGDFCMTRQYTPFPAGWWNERGGYYIIRNRTAGCLEEYGCQMHFSMHGGSKPISQPSVAGMGGWSSVRYGGGCNCSYTGGPGMVIITYYT